MWDIAAASENPRMCEVRVYIVRSDIQVAVFRSGMTRERVARVWTGAREVRETECVPGGHRWDLSSLSWSVHRLGQRLACEKVAKTLERWLGRVLLQKLTGRQAMAQTPNVVFPPAAGVAIFGWGGRAWAVRQVASRFEKE